jgi:6,7-dimethyl-8-ribityllumazine synthase
VHEGALVGTGLRVGVVVARFNELITRQLLDGCVAALRRHGVRPEDVEVAWVPGSFELGTAALALARTGRVDAVICLGCIIRGATSHYDHVASAATTGVQQASLQTGVPCIFGVVTAENHEQAFDRAGIKAGNRGSDAAIAGIEMATLLRSIGTSPPPPHRKEVSPMEGRGQAPTLASPARRPAGGRALVPLLSPTRGGEAGRGGLTSRAAAYGDLARPVCLFGGRWSHYACATSTVMS